jgi:hypothetical protein
MGDDILSTIKEETIGAEGNHAQNPSIPDG